MHQMHVALCLLLQLVTTVTAEWELPFNISQHFLRVVGGYPTFIESFYPPVENITVAADDELLLPPLWASSYTRLLNWTCDVFPADGSTCTSSITLQKCRGDSQYSVGFWRVAGNSSCEKRGQLVQCANATINGSMCQNAVVEVHNASSAVHFVLRDLELPSVVTQTFTDHYVANSTARCYYPAFPILGEQPLYLNRASADGRCGAAPSVLIPFRKNSTSQCFVQRSALEVVDACPSADQIRAMFVSNASSVCNCGSCGTPVFQQPPPVHDYNSTSCLIPHRATITFTHANGFINGAYVSYSYRAISSRETTILLTIEARFLDYRPPCQKTRFELQRGRFHCPSDVTCWRELWWPLNDLSPSSVPIVGTVTIALLLLLLVAVRRRRSASAVCDCRFVQSSLDSAAGSMKTKEKTQ